MSLSSSDGVAVCGPPPAGSCSTPSLGRPIIALLALLFACGGQAGSDEPEARRSPDVAYQDAGAPMSKRTRIPECADDADLPCEELVYDLVHGYCRRSIACR